MATHLDHDLVKMFSQSSRRLSCEYYNLKKSYSVPWVPYPTRRFAGLIPSAIYILQNEKHVDVSEPIARFKAENPVLAGRIFHVRFFGSNAFPLFVHVKQGFKES